MCLRGRSCVPFCARSAAPALLLALLAALPLGCALEALAQSPPPIPAESQPARQHGQPASAQPTDAITPADAQAPKTEAKPAETAATKAEPAEAGEISEEEIRQILVGKPLYLRGGYLDDNLTFNERGQLIGHSPQGSYTLNGIEIERVKLTKHKLELEGARYGLHFLGALPYEDPTTAVDRVKITPKKRVVRITIDRELVLKEKEIKSKGKASKQKAQPMEHPVSGPAPQPSPGAAAGAPASSAPASPAPGEPTEAEQVKAQIAQAPASERPADPTSVTATRSSAHAAKLLKDALNTIFASGFDDKMMAAMPDFWKLYYQAAAAKTDYRPSDPAVLRQNMVDKKARLVSILDPQSNEWAQAAGVAGAALYHAVIGGDGKPVEIAVGRPIGFGLDENAVDAIRKAKFEAAVKDGKPVPVMLDLLVQFRIYSQRTGVNSPKPVTPDKPAQPDAPVLPGPYSVQH